MTKPTGHGRAQAQSEQSSYAWSSGADAPAEPTGLTDFQGTEAEERRARLANREEEQNSA